MILDERDFGKNLKSLVFRKKMIPGSSVLKISFKFDQVSQAPFNHIHFFHKENQEKKKYRTKKNTAHQSIATNTVQKRKSQQQILSFIHLNNVDKIKIF